MHGYTHKLILYFIFAKYICYNKYLQQLIAVLKGKNGIKFQCLLSLLQNHFVLLMLLIKVTLVVLIMYS